MTKKTVSILGVKIPLDTLAMVTSTPPTGYSTYIAGASSIFYDLDKSLFSAIAERRSTAIPTKQGRMVQFFQYSKE